MTMRRAFPVGLALAAVLASTLTGCAYSTRSGLPEHIQTVAIPVFGNKTFYRGIESDLTRAVIERIEQDPNVRVVNDGEDAAVTGEIVRVAKRVVTETDKDDPAAVRLTVVVEVTFEDFVQGKKILDRVPFQSHRVSSRAGVYDLERGGSESEAVEQALRELADEIARRTVGMW